jgi:hypothetical protein
MNGLTPCGKHELPRAGVLATIVKDSLKSTLVVFILLLRDFQQSKSSQEDNFGVIAELSVHT